MVKALSTVPVILTYTSIYIDRKPLLWDSQWTATVMPKYFPSKGLYFRNYWNKLLFSVVIDDLDVAD